jgi:hypothetical protein
MYFNMIIVYSQKVHNLLVPLHHTMKYIFISKMFAYTKCIENYLSIIKTLSWDLINIFSSVYTYEKGTLVYKILHIHRKLQIEQPQ